MKHSPEELEKLIHENLRTLPHRRAPRTLEGRVLAAIEARAALPWWRKSFAQWPVAMRCLFLLVSGGVVKLALMATVWVMGDFDRANFTSAFSNQFAWLERLRNALTAIADYSMLVFHSIPPVWLYGGLACLAAVYVTLFGIGAAAYRTLYANR